nr:MAG TPA: hypothetical protein [Caudoviricetes sp.]
MQKHESHQNEIAALLSHKSEIIIYLTNDSNTC